MISEAIGMKLNKLMLISIIMLVLGVIQAFGTDGLGIKEWSIVACGSLIAFGIGVWQEYILVNARSGAINKKPRTMLIILSFVILFVLKASIVNLVPSHLNDGGPAVFLQVFFTIFGLLLGRAVTQKPMDNIVKTV
jgi:hypothetical protein